MNFIRRVLMFALLLIVSAGCGSIFNNEQPDFVYIHETEKSKFQLVESFDKLKTQKDHVIKKMGGGFGNGMYLNSYYDEQNFYISASDSIYIYNLETGKTTEMKGYHSNAMKKINGEIWAAIDVGLAEDGYVSKICVINDTYTMDCRYEVKNQQVTDFYFDFANDVFFAAGPGVGKEEGDEAEQYKIVKYDMKTGKETPVKNNGKHILAGRVTNICKSQFITSDGDIYADSGIKLGEIRGSKGGSYRVLSMI